MNTDHHATLHAKVNMETSRIHWKELQRFFASGVAIQVSETLDLVNVALQVQEDNKSQFEAWLLSGLIAKVTDQQALAWINEDAVVWAVVVSPWVLVQEIKPAQTGGLH
jgi:hypothetical protein